LLLLLLICKTSCGAPPDDRIDIVFDPCEPVMIEAAGAAESELADIAGGIAMWNSVAGTKLTTAMTASSTAARIRVRFEDAAPAFFRGV
jgi:hypothetical protein